MDDEFKVPSEEVVLPSRGMFYAGQKSTVKIKYLTAEEIIFFSLQTLLKAVRCWMFY
jgi:hypothetical protein